MTGTDLNLGGIRSDLDENNNPEVLLSFTDKGNGKFQRITKEEYQRGQLYSSPQHFAVVAQANHKLRSFAHNHLIDDPHDLDLSATDSMSFKPV